RDGAWLEARFDGKAIRLPVFTRGARVTVHDATGQRFTLERVPAWTWETSDSAMGNRILAPMPGKIVLVKAAAGDDVAEGQDIIIMEAMKMELALKAPRAGTLSELRAAAGDFVEADAVLASFAE